MVIIVEGHLIETKEIWDVVEMDIRYHGFMIKLLGPKEIIIGEKQVFENDTMTKRGKNDRYRKLRESVIELWQKDKADIPVLKL